MIICLKFAYGHTKNKLVNNLRVKRGAKRAFIYLPQKKKARKWMQWHGL